MFAADGYRFGGRDFSREAEVQQICAELPSLQAVVWLSYLREAPPPAGLPGVRAWQALMRRPPVAREDFRYERVPWDHPLWVLFSSGTTGLPKAIVHSHVGALIEHLKLTHFHFGLSGHSAMFFYSTTGWVMWNLVLSALLAGSAAVLYDGSPAWPESDTLWQLAEEAEVTCFGAGAAYLVSCMREGVVPRTNERPLAKLRSIGSTGSPLPPEAFRWVSEQFGDDLWLFSTSGGTDVCTAFVGGCPVLPVYEGELQSASLGVSLRAFDEAGESLIGEVGELVITEPLPSMPVCFWGDDDGSRLRESYFEIYPGLWRHGDWIEITERGTAIIYGRSDSTINRGGVRIGTSEIYRSVLREPGIADALVVDLPTDQSGAESSILLFVVLADGTPTELMRASQGDEVRFGAPSGLDVSSLGERIGAVVTEASPGEYVVASAATPLMVAAITAWLAEMDLPLADLRAGRQRLEDVFLRLTADADAKAPEPTPSRRRRSRR